MPFAGEGAVQLRCTEVDNFEATARLLGGDGAAFGNDVMYFSVNFKGLLCTFVQDVNYIANTKYLYHSVQSFHKRRYPRRHSHFLYKRSLWHEQ